MTSRKISGNGRARAFIPNRGYLQDEIASIAKKRSDFEHKLNARGSYPSDYARYAEYEMNLETLRRKRVRRMGVKASNHSGQRRIFFVLDRATKKFHGDVGLWMQYIEYARKEKAYKKLSQIFSSVLRLHPTKPELWIYAAKYAMDTQADMTEARSYMQRGLRFCKSSRLLWLEYAKLEMLYVAKIAARGKILGLGQESISKKTVAGTEDGTTADTSMIPENTAGGRDSDLDTSDAVDQVSSESLSAKPAFSGAIPIAIFDAAMKQFSNDITSAQQFFDMFARFSDVTSTQTVLDHVLQAMLETDPSAPSTMICFIRHPTILVETTSVEFPRALGSALERLKPSLEKTSSAGDLAARIIGWVLELLENEELDDALRRVLSVTLAQTVRSFERAADKGSGVRQEDTVKLIESLMKAGRPKEAQRLLTFAAERWGTNDQLQALTTSVSLSR